MSKIITIPAGTPNDENRDYLPLAIKGSDMVVNENGNNVNNDNNAVRPALLSSGLKLLCKYTKSVPRAKESDSLSNFRENICRRQR